MLTHTSRLTRSPAAAAKRLEDAMRFAHRKAAEAKTQSPTAGLDIRPFIVPGISETSRAIPNHIARSGIFAPIRRGASIMHKETVFLSARNIQITGSGEQLSEDHADIWMHAMYLQATSPAGQRPIVNRADFLRGIGRNTSGASYQWLHEGMKDLARFTLCIEARRPDGSAKYSFGMHPACRVLPMMGGFDYADGVYTLVIDPRWAQIFGNREYALIDWETRQKLRGNLARSLQRLIATSADTQQRYSLQWLKDRAHHTGHLRNFRAALLKALEELTDLNLIASPQIGLEKGREVASWVRNNGRSAS
ncbi:TrfA [Castellaniella sp. S9]|uniref:TrfA n=1 Tax=Castellaniella sp. S9 TaxID=2993652 RepID=UPI0022B42200|nr:TrfA [Castellaniella sp. S9]